MKNKRKICAFLISFIKKMIILVVALFLSYPFRLFFFNIIWRGKCISGDLHCSFGKRKNVAVQGIVKNDNLLTNVGGSYEPSTGIFTAPYKCVYTISCSIMSNPSNSVYLGIMKNGEMQSVIFSASKRNPQSGLTLQLLLNQEDNIWIQSRNKQVAKLDKRGICVFRHFNYKVII